MASQLSAPKIFNLISIISLIVFVNFSCSIEARRVRELEEGNGNPTDFAFPPFPKFPFPPGIPKFPFPPGGIPKIPGFPDIPGLPFPFFPPFPFPGTPPIGTPPAAAPSDAASDTADDQVVG